MNDARPDRSPATGRALLVVSCLLALGAAALAATAVWPASDDEVVLDVTAVTAPAMPPTVPPLHTPSPVPASAAAPADGTVDAAGVPTTVASDLSPLAELLGVPGSAIPPTIEPRVRPSTITIDDIELWGPVRAVGLEDDGQLEIPDETEIGWYRYGSSPGREGATVLAAHVSWNDTIGPFHQLGALEPGARVDVTLEDDTVRTYEVVERTMYDKDSLPRERIWRTTGDETLVLITCGGSFNPEIRRYRQNIVVYAVPVG